MKSPGSSPLNVILGPAARPCNVDHHIAEIRMLYQIEQTGLADLGLQCQAQRLDVEAHAKTFAVEHFD